MLPHVHPCARVRSTRLGHALTDRSARAPLAPAGPCPPTTVEPEGMRVHGPTSPGWLMVALCAVTGACCLLRMHGTGAEQRHLAGAEALMGFGMAAMAVPAAVVTPPDWAWILQAAVFGAAALHALCAVRAARHGLSHHHLHHLIGDLTMVYMAVLMAGSGSPAHHGHGGVGVPALTGALLLYFTGYTLLSGARLLSVPGVAAVASAGGGGTGAVARGDRPELARACRVSMGIATVAMLVTL